jgi:hypothetical protein
VLGDHQQQGNGDHALRQPGADISQREPAHPRLGKQLAVRRGYRASAHSMRARRVWLVRQAVIWRTVI